MRVVPLVRCHNEGHTKLNTGNSHKLQFQDMALVNFDVLYLNSWLFVMYFFSKRTQIPKEVQTADAAQN